MDITINQYVKPLLVRGGFRRGTQGAGGGPQWAEKN